jgi:hypothetical protein
VQPSILSYHSRVRISRQFRAFAVSLFLIGACVTPGIAAPQTAPAGNDDQALRDIAALYEQAFRQGQPAMLSPHLSPEFHGVTVTGRVVRNLAALTTYWREIRARIGDGATYSTTVTPEPSVVLGDIALARGTSDNVIVTGDGKELRIAASWTATLRKEDGVWKIRQVQATMDPIGNAFVREFSRQAMYIVAGIAGAIGVVVGAVLWGLSSRSRPRRKPRAGAPSTSGASGPP